MHAPVPSPLLTEELLDRSFCVPGQAGAIRLGIARALQNFNPKFRPQLKSGAHPILPAVHHFTAGLVLASWPCCGWVDLFLPWNPTDRLPFVLPSPLVCASRSGAAHPRLPGRGAEEARAEKGAQEVPVGQEVSMQGLAARG